MDDVTSFKLISILCIWVIGFVGGLAPFFLSNIVNPRTLSILNCFSAGIFIAGGFLHLLHDAIENPALSAWSTENNGRYAFPYAEAFCTLGFLAVFSIEQFAHTYMQSPTKSPAASPDKSSSQKTKSLPSSCPDAPFLSSPPQLKIASAPKNNDTPNGAVAIVLFIALSFHSIMEGLGIGANSEAAWGVFLAIIMHKGLAAFALGSGLLRTKVTTTTFIVYMIVFSFMSTFGILLGWIIESDSSSNSAATGICLALSSGTFIFVAVMEVLPQEFAHHVNVPLKMTALFTGYLLFGALAFWT